MDSLLYVDTDTLFLSPPEDFWNLYSSFNSTQIAAVAVDDIKQAEHIIHPYYEPYGKD